MPPAEAFLRPLLGSARTRIVGWFLVLLIVAQAVAVLAVRQVLLLRLQEEFERDLAQEVEELRTLGRQGSDPLDGQPFGDRLDRLFSVFLARNIPDRDELFLAFLDGELYERSRGEPLARLDQDPRFLSAVARSGATERGLMESAAGPVEYLSVPLEVDGEPRGIFCVFIFRAPEVAEINAATRVQVGVVVLVVVLSSGGEEPKTAGNEIGAVSPPPAAQAPPPAATPTKVNRANTQVAVLNGTTTTGLARGVADKREKSGFTILKVGDNAGQAIATTTIAYSTGNERAARTVAQIMDVSSSAVKLMDMNTSVAVGPEAKVVVIVGNDRSTAG